MRLKCGEGATSLTTGIPFVSTSDPLNSVFHMDIGSIRILQFRGLFVYFGFVFGFLFGIQLSNGS